MTAWPIGSSGLTTRFRVTHIKLPAAVFVVLLLAAAGCSDQELSPLEVALAPVAAADSTEASASPAKPLPTCRIGRSGGR